MVHCAPSIVRCARIGMDTLFSRSAKRTKGGEHKTYTYKTQRGAVTYWGKRLSRVSLLGTGRSLG